MDVLVFGGGSETGQYILKSLAANQFKPFTLAETENQARQLKDYGAAEVNVTTSDNFIDDCQDCDAFIFIAGESPVSGETKDMLVDLDAFKKTVAEAKQQQINRFVYLSAVRSEESEESQATGAKQEPEKILQQDDLPYTIIRSTLAVNKPGKGTVTAATSLKDKEEEIPHEDLAAFLVEALISKNAINQIIEVTAGDTPIKEALEKFK